MARVLTPRAEDFPRWYQDVVAKAELAENGPVRGTMVIRPAGYAIWERMQAEMDTRIKAAGAQNAYFPLFIPEAYLRREAQHVEGFSPELAVVTHAGGKQLAEPVVVRPTSETVIGEFMAKWVGSYRDLPLLLNQWSNVVRWELRPRVFLRTSEFLWQEGHTAHATADDARGYARRILHEVYEDFMVNVLAMPVLCGRKTARERFAGATNTLTLEAMMGDGKALQMGTSHELGQNFARAFDITYSTASGTVANAWTTSWGTSTRMVGGLIMCHGDDHGLRVPPRLAPVQAYVMVVKASASGPSGSEARGQAGASGGAASASGPSGSEARGQAGASGGASDGAAGGGVIEAATKLRDALHDAGVRVALDDRVDIAFGRRAVDAELKGYPVRVEVGPRDLAAGNAVLVRRRDGSKAPTPLGQVVAEVRSALADDQHGLYEQARALRESRTTDVSTLDDAIEAARTGWARVPWAVVGEEGEARANQDAVTVRCLLRPDGSVPEAEDEPDLVAILGRSY